MAFPLIERDYCFLFPLIEHLLPDLTVRGTEVKEGTVATLTCTIKWASVAPEELTWSVEGQGVYSSSNATGSGHVVRSRVAKDK